MCDIKSNQSEMQLDKKPSKGFPCPYCRSKRGERNVQPVREGTSARRKRNEELCKCGQISVRVPNVHTN